MSERERGGRGEMQRQGKMKVRRVMRRTGRQDKNECEITKTE